MASPESRRVTWIRFIPDNKYKALPSWAHMTTMGSRDARARTPDIGLMAPSGGGEHRG